MNLILINVFLSLLFFVNTQEVPQLRDGDIIFQTSTSAQSRAIELATHSDYSHVGIVHVDNDEVLVYEAVQPVRLTPLKQWIKRGKNGKYVVKRLKNADELLTAEVVQRMKISSEQYLDKNYDVFFEWSDDRLYCSELVWKIYKQGANISVGELQKLKEFDLTHELVKTQLKERYGNNIPLEEMVVSPQAIFESKNLITVYKN